MSVAPNQRTMLVDLIFAAPKWYLSGDRAKSHQRRFGQSQISDAVINPNLLLVVLPTNEPVQKSAEVLSSKLATESFPNRGSLSERIVILTCPLMAADDQFPCCRKSIVFLSLLETECPPA
jgi:hypothetical protein